LLRRPLDFGPRAVVKAGVGRPLDAAISDVSAAANTDWPRLIVAKTDCGQGWLMSV
jgi:hypothetical protein